MKCRAVRIDGWTDMHNAWDKPPEAPVKIILEFLMTQTTLIVIPFIQSDAIEDLLP
jgi:hypothetical protein